MTRAAPMPPELRRAAIIQATLPLIERYGTGVTTRQVAEAACVAEGTIFRVFESLQALIEATIVAAFSSQQLAALLEDVDLGTTLPELTSNAVGLLTNRLNATRSMMMAMHHSSEGPSGGPAACMRVELLARRQELDTWLTAHFEPFADQLSVSPAQYVAFLRQIAAGSAFSLGEPLETGLSASLALHGALRKEPM